MKSDILSTLVQEHFAISRIANHLSWQLEAAGHHRAAHIDFELMLESLGWLSRFMKVAHRPKEEALIRCAFKRREFARPLIEPLLREDEAQTTESMDRFHTALSSVVHGHVVERARLAELGARAVANLRKQIRAEERAFYLWAERQVNPPDETRLGALARRLEARPFRQRLSTQYDVLVAKLESERVSQLEGVCDAR